MFILFLFLFLDQSTLGRSPSILSFLVKSWTSAAFIFRFLATPDFIAASATALATTDGTSADKAGGMINSGVNSLSETKFAIA